jgi:nitrite reductase/ring-hydroxylating ferredoxin subunit
MLNSTAIVLFSAGWALSRRFRRTGLVLQSLGAGAISVGGWMGGTLAFRNQIGVDHRYANAGKWQEETREHGKSRALTSAAAGGELELNQMALVHAGDERIAVGRTEQGYAAFEDRCTHRGGPLSDGVLICGTVQCPWHGSQFDVHSGEVKCGPAERDIKTYDIEQLHVPRKVAG